MSRFALALDIGGSHVTAAVVDVEQRLLLPDSLTRKNVEEQAPAQHLLDIWALAAHQAHRLVGSPRLQHIGIAMPSPFDYQQGISLHQHKFQHLHGLNLTCGLQERWASSALGSTPVLYGNDADLFVLGEWWGGAAQGARRVLGITLGTGLGSGFLEHGRVLNQDPRIPPEGEMWNTPFLGSIAEDHASGRAITRHFRHLTCQDWNVQQISAAARQQNPSARLVMHHFGTQLGRILRPWVEHFEPDVLLLGGNISRAHDTFEEMLLNEIPECNLRISPLLEQASLFGAAALQTQPSAQV